MVIAGIQLASNSGLLSRLFFQCTLILSLRLSLDFEHRLVLTHLALADQSLTSLDFFQLVASFFDSTRDLIACSFEAASRRLLIIIRPCSSDTSCARFKVSDRP